MFLYGAGGHAKVIIDILQANSIGIDGIFDDNSAVTQLLKYKVLPSNHVEGPLIISIGHNQVRKRIADSLSVAFGTAIHPSAILSEYATIGEGTAVMQGSVIQSCTTIGRHCIINTGASIDHECALDDYVHVSPHATLCGNVAVGEGTWIGAGAIIIPGIKIGKWCIVGAGAVVTKEVPDHTVVAGVPAKILRSQAEK